MQNPNINIIYTDDDIFKSEPYSIIVHACNTLGFWGAGIAKQMKFKYPMHYMEYYRFCIQNEAQEILGGCLLLDENIISSSKKHHIACLFTNLGVSNKSPSEREIQNVISATRQCIGSLFLQMQEDRSLGTTIKDIHMPKINSGYFGVPWERTEQCIKSLDTKYKVNIYIHTV